MGIRSIRIRILAIVFISLLPVLMLLLYKAFEQHGQETAAIILLALTGFAASLIAWFGSDIFIMRRMRGLAASTDELANGNVSVRAPISGRNDEIDQFAMRFNKMAEALERQIIERTAAQENLKASCKQLEGIMTEHVETGNELRKMSYHNDLILRSSGEGILGLDLNGCHTFVNPSAAKMLGYGEQELIGMHSHPSWHHTKADGRPYPEEECLIYKTFIDGKFHRSRSEVFWRKDGTSFPVSYMSSPIKEQGKTTGAVVTFRDITESKKAEEAHEKLELQLCHAQKMEVVGQLTGGIAHDFNNIISAMMGFASLCQIEMNEDDPAYKYIANILTLSERAANLTKSLLTFCRKQIVDLKPVNLQYCVRTVLVFIEKIIGKDIKLASNMADEDLIVVADSGQLEQVLMNLAANARDAMPGGGTISINTEKVEIDREFIENNGFGKEGKYALITVSDTGIGMDEQTRKKVFEPFFTTKEVGKGTGLGLAMAYGIIKQHNGFLNVNSEPGLGATFKIYLPAVKIIVEEKKKAETTVLTGGSETILLAEDDASVMKTLKIALQGAGYSVIEAFDGAQAVAIFRENQDKINLFLTDVIMPNKNGIEAFREMTGIKPDSNVLFMSGYASDVIDKEFRGPKFQFIPKPVSVRELLKKVRETLDQ